jgi:asparagine synthase (glutamine-hydrolysing)
MKFIGQLFDKIKPDFITGSYTNFHNILVSDSFYVEENPTCSVLFSGEIYDYPGKPQKINDSKNPSLIALQLIQDKGIASILSLNGKFITLVKLENKLYIIRDRLGIQSVVYYNNQIVSNSLNLIKESNLFKMSPDINSLAVFLQKGYIAAPATPFENLSKLAPGEYLEYNLETKSLLVKSTLSYEDFLNSRNTVNLSFEEAEIEYGRLHQQAISQMIEGKNKIGILLSGGYDSGGNLAGLRKIYNGPINAYSVGFKDNEWSELPLAELMAKKFNANFQSFILDGSELEHLPEIVKKMEEPFFENGLFVNFKIADSIPANQTDVILGGDGNDQFFGTSARELAIHYILRKYGLMFFQKAFRPLLNNIPSLYRYSFHNESILNAIDVQHFGLSEKEISGLLQSKIPGKKGKSYLMKPGKSFDDLYTWKNYHSDILLTATQVIIYKSNRLTQSDGLHMVFPYADFHVFDFLKSLPVNYKHKGKLSEIIKGKSKSKFLLKAHMKTRLPEEITNRKKQGGFAPLELFLKEKNIRTEIYSFAKKVLVETGLFNATALEKYLDRTEKILGGTGYWFWHTQKVQSQLMYLLVLAIWWQQFVNNEDYNSLSQAFEKNRQNES